MTAVTNPSNLAKGSGPGDQSLKPEMKDVWTQTIDLHILHLIFDDYTKACDKVLNDYVRYRDKVKDQVANLDREIAKLRTDLGRLDARKMDKSQQQMAQSGFGTIGRLETRMSSLERTVWRLQGWNQ